MASVAEAPRCYVASPEIYKVIAESGDTRIILASWKAGQRNAWHSHPPGTSVYALTDCEAFRLYSPDGQSLDASVKAGHAEVHTTVHSHSFENRSKAECKILFVENE